LENSFTADVSHLLKDTQTLPVSQNVISWCVVLFGTFLSGYGLLNASRAAVNDFGAKYVAPKCSQHVPNNVGCSLCFHGYAWLLMWLFAAVKMHCGHC
jgi:hypothetical protein